MRLHSLDDARFDRNISFVEQEFQPSPGAQSIDRGAQLLALVLDAEAPRALGELAADAGLPKSTASRLLGALERNGLVEQEGLRGAFRAGPVMARFAGRGISARRVVEAAERPMAALAEATGETINVAVASPGGVEHLAQVESRHYLGTSHWVGRRVPYHCSANGKVLLAFAAAGATAGPLEALTSRTITEPALLAAELETIRREGFATAVDELELGLSAVAAPVLDESGRAIAALSVSGPTLRLSPRRVAELRPIVIKQARALAEQLGHRTEGVHAA
jgi:IclR family transcriptional regulator, acetate operon repressor